MKAFSRQNSRHDLNMNYAIMEKNIEYFKNNRTDYWFCLINNAYNCAVSGNKEYAMRNYKRACLVKPWCFISNITYYFRIVKALHQEGGF